MKVVLLLATVLATTTACKARQNVATLRANDGASTASEDDQLLPDYQPVALGIEVDEASAVGPDSELAATALSLDDGGGADSYYMTVFGYQGRGPLNLPRNAHTYAMFVHAQGAALASARLETFTISWMPDDGVVRAGMGVKRGRNYSFADTMQTPRENGLDLRRSPLVKITPDLYSRILRRYNKLEAGSADRSVQYMMNDDTDGRAAILRLTPGGYTNCIHAISDSILNSDGTLLETGLMRGFAASDTVFSFLSRAGALERGRSYDEQLAGRLRI